MKRREKQNNISKSTADSGGGPKASVSVAQDLLASVGLPDQVHRTRALVALCLLAAPETVAFDYEEYREGCSEDRYFTEGLSAAESDPGRRHLDFRRNAPLAWWAPRLSPGVLVDWDGFAL